MACTCVNVAPGSYANQETRALPFATVRFPVAGTKLVGIDRCVLPDIEALWAMGIETVESCCGHGSQGYVAVVESAIPVMLEMGYQHDPRLVDRPEIFAWPRRG